MSYLTPDFAERVAAQLRGCTVAELRAAKAAATAQRMKSDSDALRAAVSRPVSAAERMGAHLNSGQQLLGDENTIDVAGRNEAAAAARSRQSPHAVKSVAGDAAQRGIRDALTSSTYQHADRLGQIFDNEHMTKAAKKSAVRKACVEHHDKSLKLCGGLES